MPRQTITSGRLLTAAAVLAGLSAVMPAGVSRMVTTPSRVIWQTLSVPVRAPLHALSVSMRGEPIQQVVIPAEEHPVLALQSIRALQDEVRLLREENARLRQSSELLGDRSIRFVSARVAGGGENAGARFLTLDRGSSDGVRPGQVVVHGAYLVGEISEAGPVTSTVQLINSRDQSVQVALAPPVIQATPRPIEPFLSPDKDGERFTVREGIPRDLGVSVGDLAQVRDPRLPREAQAFFVGPVTRVEPLPGDPDLRDWVEVEPVLPLQLLRQVEVLVPGGGE